MLGFTRTQWRTIGILALGVWLIALSMGIARACAWDLLGATPAHVPAEDSQGHAFGRNVAIGCAQFCRIDIPVVTKIPSFGEQPDATPPVVAIIGFQTYLAPTRPFKAALVAHSSSNVPPFLRFAHLRL